jgi:hypothetical protein
MSKLHELNKSKHEILKLHASLGVDSLALNEKGVQISFTSNPQEWTLTQGSFQISFRGNFATLWLNGDPKQDVKIDSCDKILQVFALTLAAHKTEIESIRADREADTDDLKSRVSDILNTLE